MIAAGPAPATVAGDDREGVDRVAPASRVRGWEETIRRLLILIVLYSIPIYVMMQPVIDPDVWWHLRTGEWILAHRAVPVVDTFSQYGQGQPWVDYSWLFQVPLATAYSWLGLHGILLFRIVGWFAALIAIHRLVLRREPNFFAANGLTALAFIAILPMLNERPWLCSVFFCALTLDAVLHLRSGTDTKAIWLLPLGYVFWANLHIQFVYGLCVLGLACVAPAIDWWLGNRRADESAATLGSRGWWRLVLLAGACAAATVLSPYFLGVHRLVLEFAGGGGMYNLITEMQALPFRNLASWAVLVLAGLACFSLGKRQRLSAFDVLLLAGTAWISFRSQRDCWFVVLAALAILTTRPRPARSARAEFPLTGSRVLLIAGVLIAVAVVVGCARGLTADRLQAAVAERYPARAAAVVEERGYAGPLYNHFNWGGYLIWRLRSLPVAIDGRANVHGDRRIVQFAQVWAGSPTWATDPELAAAGVVIAGANQPLTQLLRRDGRFRCVYEDSVAVVFVAARE